MARMASSSNASGLLAGSGRFLRQVNGHLVGVIERAAQCQRLGRVETEPRLDEIKSRRRADAERGRGQYARGNLS